MPRSTVTTIRPRNIACTAGCGRFFSSHGGLNNHLLTHRVPEARNRSPPQHTEAPHQEMDGNDNSNAPEVYEHLPMVEEKIHFHPLINGMFN